MERLRSLNRFQKAILILMTAIVIVFTVLYPLTISRVGFAYHDAILIPNQENGSTVYSGKIQGTEAHFTVSADKAVTFQYGDKTYGPYTAQEDPSAIPQDNELREYMTGIELFCGNEVLFRGGVLEHSDYLTLFREDDSLYDLGITVTGSNGIVIDENGDRIDPMEPSASTILEIMAGPTLTHKGSWPPWIGGVLICAVTVLSILFADELFRWNLSFRIRDVEQAEPSDWEIAQRYISWIVLPILALALFIIGLQ
ncbi:hypothetical protein [Agathobaculum sp. Marseille-P7918]|uniref:hypothetical protein n=1 Tax=Agathobaculum sp. Marseille-P7918 TaxID=2479843 RepID=UPI000F63D81E|nr:hypothetical protein [Agathobaculum sp. Marseille-P7918]